MKKLSAFLQKIFPFVTGNGLKEQKNLKIDFQFAINNVQGYGIVVYDVNGIIISWNAGAELMSGYKAENVIGKSFEIFYTKDDIDNGIPWQNLTVAKETGRFEMEGPRVRKAGVVRWANVVYSPVKNDSGALCGYLVIIRDTTDANKTREQLELFSKQIDQSNESIYTVDENYKITSWNKGAENLYGFAKEEVLGKIPNELLQTEITQDDLSEALCIIKKEGNWSGEFKRTTKTGKIIYVHSSTSEVKDSTTGKLSGFIGVSFDITHQRKLQAQINHLASIVEQSTDAIRSSGLDQRILTWNKGAEELYGYTKEEAIGNISTSLGIVKRTNAQADAFFNSVLEKGFVKTETEFFRKDGTIFFGSVTASAVKNDSGEVDSIVFIVKDISLHKLQEEQLRKSNEELEQKVKERTAEVLTNEKRFRALVENNQSIISVLDKNFDPIYLSPVAERITGWTLQERRANTAFEMGHPDEMQDLALMAKNVLENPGKAFNIVTRSKHKNGTYIWLEGIVTNRIDDPDVGGIVSNLIDITERRKAEETIHKSEALYRNLFENILHGFAYCKAVFEDGRLTDCIYLNVNEEYEKHTGVFNIAGKKMSDVLPGVLESDASYAEMITSVAWFGKTAKFETFAKPFGKWFSISFYCPEKEYFVSLVDDITERKHAEEAIRKSEILYRSLFENMRHGFAYFETVFEDGRLTDCIYLAANGVCEQNVGVKNLVGKRMNEVTPGILEPDSLYAQRISIIALTGASALFETYVAPLDIWFSVSLYSPEKGYFVSLVDDISERKRAEEKIRKSEALYRSLFENMLHGFAYCKGIFENNKLTDFIYLAVNGEYESMHNTKNISGKKVSEAIPGLLESDTIYCEILGRVSVSGNPEKFETHLVHLNKWVSASIYSTEEKYFVILLDEITERKKAEVKIIRLNEELEERVKSRTKQLKKSNEDLEAFSYSVSHDLRAPLRGIIGFTSILEDEYASKLDDEAKRITAVIRNNTIRMGHLIDDLLSFSRMGRQDLVKTTFETGNMVNEIISEINFLNENNPKINWIIHTLHKIHADINTIRQVWTNLISNAVKYSGKTRQPIIEIGSFEQDNSIVFFIKDNGIGFDEKYRNKLFKVFQRLQSAEEFEGTGIGLAIIEKIISKHDGKVWAQGMPGKGANFYFSLPANHKIKSNSNNETSANHEFKRR